MAKKNDAPFEDKMQEVAVLALLSSVVLEYEYIINQLLFENPDHYDKTILIDAFERCQNMYDGEALKMGVLMTMLMLDGMDLD